MSTELLTRTVLYSTGAKPGYVPDFSPLGQQVVCGPRWQDLEVEGQVRSVGTPWTYDIAAVIDALPVEQRPEIVIVKTDAFWSNTPRNLGAVSCPKVLLFGDTHHGDRPIRQLLKYLETEPFDHVVLLYDRHHAHWLSEAGHERVYSMPGLDIQFFDLPFREERRQQIVFVGQTGKLHPRRTSLIQELAARRYPLRVQLAGREESSRLFAESLITFNCSLNADLNMRIFEALEAGAFLLTDRLSLQSGLTGLFEDGKHLVCYESPADLVDKAGYYLAHPEEALAIARAGYDWCREKFHPARLAMDLLAIVQGEVETAAQYMPRSDGRMALPVAAPDRLEQRAGLYELMQDIHRQREVVKVLCFGAAQSVCDLADLPRLRVHLVEEATSEPDLVRIQDAGVGEQVWLVKLEHAATGEWDTVVLGADRVDSWLERALAVLQFRRLVIAGWSADRAGPFEKMLSARGFVPNGQTPGVFERPEKAPVAQQAR